MKYLNEVRLAGYVYNALWHKTKDERDYVSLVLCISEMVGQKKITNYISVMVFDAKQVEYLKGVGVEEGNFAVVFGSISVKSQPKKLPMLSILVKNITVAKQAKSSGEYSDTLTDDEMSDIINELQDETQYF